MAGRGGGLGQVNRPDRKPKGTSIGRGMFNTSGMNKKKKASKTMSKKKTKSTVLDFDDFTF